MSKYRFFRRFSIIMAIVLVVSLVLVSFFENNVKEIIYNMARAKVRALATNAFNNAVSEIFDNGVDHSELIAVVFDNNGKVTMISADTVKMNQLATETALLAQEKLSQISESGVSIPIGSLFGSQMFAGRGPKINVKIIPIGSVSTQFVTEFEQAGINQTRHKIYLQATTRVNIVIPAGTNIVEVTSYVPISESIIIGEVPDSFVMVEDDNLLNLLP